MTRKSKYTKQYYDIIKDKKQHDSRINRVSKIARTAAIITFYHERAANILIERDLNIKIEKCIQTKESFYMIDIFLIDYNICIEIDGSSHDNPEAIEKDRRRDIFLKNAGYWVLRVKNSQVSKGFYQRVKNTINYRQSMINKGYFNKNLQ